MYLLFLIVAFKLFLPEQDDFLCPCTWFVAYGAIMLFLPSLTSYTIAVFAYFRQEDASGPWEVLKSLYVFKFACNFHNNRTEWDFHVKRCIRCKLVERDWPLAKIAVSAILSLLYPLAWLSLSFFQSSYYVCTQVGPTNESLQNYCKVESTNMTKTNYTKAYGLAVIRSKAIGSILFTSTLFLLGVFVIIYGEMKSYLIKRYDWTPRGSRLAKTQVNVCIIPSYSSGTLRAAKSDISRDITVARKEETAGIERQVGLSRAQGGSFGDSRRLPYPPFPAHALFSNCYNILGLLWTTTLLTRLNGADRSKLSINTATNQKNAVFFLG